MHKYIYFKEVFTHLLKYLKASWLYNVNYFKISFTFLSGLLHTCIIFGSKKLFWATPLSLNILTAIRTRAPSILSIFQKKKKKHIMTDEDLKQ